MELETPGYALRDLSPADAPDLARHADDLDIARHLRDRFPHPYTEADARDFIAVTLTGDGERAWAIDYRGEAVGVIGVVPGLDVYRGSWEIGYWLGRAHWGRGVATAAVRTVSRQLFAREGVIRLWAGIFSGNSASARVLEKAGYQREGIHRNHVIKHGRLHDEWVYARLADDAVQEDPAGKGGVPNGDAEAGI